MVLCFGVIGRVLKLCKIKTVTDAKLIGALACTVDPSNEYAKHSTTVSRLLSCQQNLSGKGTPLDGSESNRLSDIVNKALEVDANCVARDIARKVLPLLEEDKKQYIVPALYEIIARDKSISSNRRLSFQKYTTYSGKEIIKNEKVNLPTLLAGLLLYSIGVVKNKEGESCVESIDAFFLSKAEEKYPELIVSYTFDMPEDLPGGGRLFIQTDVTDESKIAIYIRRGIEKFRSMTTLLSGDQEVDFYSMYVCNLLGKEKKTKHTRYSSGPIPGLPIRDVTAVKLEEISSRIIISGTGGLGKSMMMRHLFLDTAKKYKKGGRIPVYITVRDYRNSEQSIEDFILSKFELFDTGFTREDLIHLLRFGRFVLLFDGLDEVSGKFIQQFEREIVSLSDKYQLNQIIVSSRPFSYGYSLERFTVLSLQPFSKEQAIELIQKLEFRTDIPAIKERFIERLDHDLFETHKEFAENPLLLTIMLMTFEEYADVPLKMHIFFREAYWTLAKKHDASKGAYIRPLKTGLTVEKFEKYLAEFCAKTYYYERYEFTDEEIASFFYKLKERQRNQDTDIEASDFKEDLQANLCLIYYEGGKYHFTHRSFQEYFCALYFSRQRDTSLKSIAKFFDEQRVYTTADRTFGMLYDMIPEKMEEFVICPFLSTLMEKCEEQGGYHGFLLEMYPKLHYEEGYVPIRLLNTPAYGLYGFIRSLFFDEELENLGLPTVKDFMIGEYAHEYNKENHNLVNLKLIEEDFEETYGMRPKIVGREYLLDIKTLLKKADAYPETLAILENDSFILRREYEALRRFYGKMEARHVINGDDFFDEMI